jgi:hypothetical protein
LNGNSSKLKVKTPIKMMGFVDYFKNRRKRNMLIIGSIVFIIVFSTMIALIVVFTSAGKQEKPNASENTTTDSGQIETVVPSLATVASSTTNLGSFKSSRASAFPSSTLSVATLKSAATAGSSIHFSVISTPTALTFANVPALTTVQSSSTQIPSSAQQFVGVNFSTSSSLSPNLTETTILDPQMSSTITASTVDSYITPSLTVTSTSSAPPTTTSSSPPIISPRNGGNVTYMFPNGCSSPRSLTLSPSGLLYFAQSSIHRISMFSSTGTLIFVSGNSTPGYADGRMPNVMFNTPLGIAFGYNDTIFVADGNNNAIRQIDENIDIL